MKKRDPQARISSTLLIISCLILSACSSTQLPAPDTAEIEQEPTPVEASSFEAETLYALLVAELAGSRGRYDIALGNYLEQAHKTRDKGLAKRSTLIARQLNAKNTALSSALLWTELEPKSNEAQLIAVTELLNAGRYLEALEKSIALEALGTPPLYISIATRAANQPEQNIRLIDRLEQQLKQSPDNLQLLAAKGILQLAHRPESALTIARQLQEIDDEFQAGLMLEAKALIKLKRNDEAKDRLETLLKRQPDNKRLRLQYARLLANVDLDASLQQFELLQQQSPEDAELTLALALVLYELKDFGTAELHFKTLTGNKKTSSISHYYLGRIGLSKNDINLAYEHFSQVGPGQDFLTAQVHRLDILMAQDKVAEAKVVLTELFKQYPELQNKLKLLEIDAYNKYGHHQKAVALLSQIISQQPQNTRLLYQRAMTYNQLDNLEAMERDLRTVIAREPQNATVLNDLGYTLMSRTKRLSEASELIEKAYQLKPEDAGIIDSMGWVEYRRGNYQQALKHLRKAMKQLPDPEIAAHLGEVLWTLKRPQEALKVWQQGLEISRDNPALNNTMERLQSSNPS